jgi:hypothetical protein
MKMRSFPVMRFSAAANGTDWRKHELFTCIATIRVNRYELVDNRPYKGTSYYRLKFNETKDESVIAT